MKTEASASTSIDTVVSVRDMQIIHAGSKNLEAASIGAAMSTPSKITPEVIVTWRKERAQQNTGLKTIQEPSNVTSINPACSFKSLAKSLSVYLYVNDTCTKCLPCGANGRIHKSNEGHPSGSSSRKLTDEVVNKVNNCRREKRNKKNTSYKAKTARNRKAQEKETKETVADKHELEATILGPGKGSRKVWNRIPDLQRTAAEADDRLCLPKAVCSLINDGQLKCIAFNSMVMPKPADGDMQVMHANKALSTHGLVLQRCNSNFLS